MQEEVGDEGVQEEEIEEEEGDEEWFEVQEISEEEGEEEVQEILEEEGEEGDDQCIISQRRFDIPVYVNCGHQFCAHCILRWWMQQSSRRSQDSPLVLIVATCLLCRRSIRNLIPTRQSLWEGLYMPQVAAVLFETHEYNHVFHGLTSSTLIFSFGYGVS